VAYKVFYTKESLDELEALLEFIRPENQTAAERLGSGLLAHIDLLRDFPRLGTSVYRKRGIRKLFHSPVTIYTGSTTDRARLRFSTSGTARGANR